MNTDMERPGREMITYSLGEKPIKLKHLEAARTNGEFVGFKAQLCDHHFREYDFEDAMIQAPKSCECMLVDCQSAAQNYFWIDVDFLDGFSDCPA